MLVTYLLIGGNSGIGLATARLLRAQGDSLLAAARNPGPLAMADFPRCEIFSELMEATLIYPHQLFDPHPAIASGRTVFLIEDPLIFGNDPQWPLSVHKGKLMLHRASMKAFDAELREQGHKVRYIETPQGSETDSAAFPNNLGSLSSFRWPVTRVDASAWLDQFIDERLEHFGAYEDAISTQHATINHSAITPMLNLGLLDPRDVIDRVLARCARVPLNSLEGFIRQVIGWREFMRGIYQHRGTAIRNTNFWHFDRPMPASFYDGSTGIPPVDRVIRQVLADGWCHHIERLMVLGNFMLLCRIRPDDVYRWFMELFVDAYDWVMVPNVYGMSQFADGGTFTTKPYLSGSNYVLKMSDEARGPWCEVWDGLFWTFIGDHSEFFLSNPRLSMMARTWMKLAPAKQETHRRAAQTFLANL